MDAPISTTITGYEPFLPLRHESRTLSLRGLATMLNVLPANAISLDAIAEALRSDAFYVRYSAAKKLGERGDRDARILMQEILSSGAAPSRASVARRLHAFTWFSAEPLVRQALNDPDVRVHEATIYALCDLQELHAFQLMTEVLAHEGDSVLNAAAWGLRNCRDVAAVPVLKMALNATDPEVRIKALESLGANETPEAIPVILAAVDDPEPDVRYAATLSLIEVAGEDSLQQIITILQQNPADPEPVLRGMFHATNYLNIKIAKHKTAHDLIAMLETLLSHPQPKVRKAAFWPLASLPYDLTSDLLYTTYQREQDSQLKSELLHILFGLMPDLYKELLEAREQVIPPVETM